MADFYQNGIVTTLPILGTRTVEDMEEEIREFVKSKARNLTLLLPALYSEFERPAIYKIIDELKKADYIRKIVLSLDMANEEQFLSVKRAMSQLPQKVIIIWHDSPEIQKLYRELLEADFPVDIRGKGRGVWFSIGYILSDQETFAIALHDCDIVNYTREIPVRLFYPIVHPALSFEFCKGYYARVNSKLYGRTARLFFTPMIRALKSIVGSQDGRYLEYLDSFRYALSGEFALVRSLAKSLRISPTWGLEVSMLSEVFEITAIDRICQVEIIENYRHKHQKISKGNVREGLGKMANDISKALFLYLSQSGVVLSEAFFRTLLTTYLLEARKAIEKYNALSLINGLFYDRHSEIEAVETFVEAIKNAQKEFTSHPIEIPMLPAWTRVRAAIPDFHQKLKETVEADN